MNKNIFRALLLGVGAVVAMQQAEAGFVFGGLRGEDAKKAANEITRGAPQPSNPTPVSQTVQPGGVQPTVNVTVNVINVGYGNDESIHNGTESAGECFHFCDLRSSSRLLDVINAAAH